MDIGKKYLLALGLFSLSACGTVWQDSAQETYDFATKKECDDTHRFDTAARMECYQRIDDRSWDKTMERRNEKETDED